MHLSGQTPLFRARNLEKYLGVESIYLKLEGSNPTGHKNDRIAEALARYALTRGYSKVLIYGSEHYIKSVIYFAKHFGLECHIAFTNKRSISKLFKEDPMIHLIRISIDKINDDIEWLETYAHKNEMFLLSEWEKKPFIRSLAIQEMMEETITRVNAPTDIWTQIKGGYTAKSIYHELMRSWIKGNIESMPDLHCGITPQLSIDEEFIENSRSQVQPISETALLNAAKLLKKLENVTISPAEAYSIAAMLESPNLNAGAHIVFLNDGKSDISINEISKNKHLDIENLVANTRKLLEPYHDSIEETTDAVMKAIQSGFIFTATRRDEIQGICIIVNMGFETFIPTYHLAYIGVKSGNAGRGVATELINRAVEKTDGKLSLHVDIPNKRAKKLYEKMGFVHCYDRMLYKG